MKQIKKNNNFTIELINVSKNYGNINAVKNISLSTKKGDIIALLGPNGA